MRLQNSPSPRCVRAISLALASMLGLACGDDGGNADSSSSSGGDSSSATATTSATATSATSASTTTDDTTAGSSSGGSTGVADSSSSGAASGSTDTSSGGAGSSSTGETGVMPQAGGTIIPLYTYPTDASWADVATGKQSHPEVGVVAIINPNSGPGPSADANYDVGITALQDAGVIVIAYVHTSYAAREPAEVEAEIATYLDQYPQLDGIMFDEMSNVPGDEDYYTSLSTYAAGLGFDLTVGNPGTDVPESFVGTVDTIFIYEATGTPDPDSLGGWHDGYDRGNFAIIPHSVDSLDTLFVSDALGHVGWIYITDDVLPNPWDSLPPYFDDLLGAVEAG